MGSACLRKIILACGLAMIGPALSACDSADKPVAVIRIGTTPNDPLMLEVARDKKILHLLFDTGSAGTVMDLDLAHRHLQPLSGNERLQHDGLPDTVGGLYGELPVTYFRSRPLRYQEWDIPQADITPAISMSATAVALGRPVDGVIGMPAISKQTWVWERQLGSLMGYRRLPPAFAGQPGGMSCTALGTSSSGAAVVRVEVAGKPSWFALDTGYTGDLSGSLSRQDLDQLRELQQIGKEVVYRGTLGQDGTPAGPRALARVKDIVIAGHHFDGLAFQETDGASRFGLAFLHKLERALLDFAGERFCFTPPATPMPDRLPSQQELDDTAAGKKLPAAGLQAVK